MRDNARKERYIYCGGVVQQKSLINNSVLNAILLVGFQPDARYFNPAPTTLRIHPCRYVSQCKGRNCLKRATMIAQKTDAAGRHIRQIELCLAPIKRTAEKAGLDNVEVKDVSQPDTGLPENCCHVLVIR